MIAEDYGLRFANHSRRGTLTAYPQKGQTHEHPSCHDRIVREESPRELPETLARSPVGVGSGAIPSLRAIRYGHKTSARYPRQG